MQTLDGILHGGGKFAVGASKLFEQHFEAQIRPALVTA